MLNPVGLCSSTDMVIYTGHVASEETFF